jgi:hypothetical protein
MSYSRKDLRAKKKWKIDLARIRVQIGTCSDLAASYITSPANA